MQEAASAEFPPKFVLADGARAITAAFNSKPERLMCWFHVKREIDSRDRSLPPDVQKTLNIDLQKLQMSQCKEDLTVVSQLF